MSNFPELRRAADGNRALGEPGDLGRPKGGVGRCRHAVEEREGLGIAHQAHVSPGVYVGRMKRRADWLHRNACVRKHASHSATGAARKVSPILRICARRYNPAECPERTRSITPISVCAMALAARGTGRQCPQSLPSASLPPNVDPVDSVKCLPGSHSMIKIKQRPMSPSASPRTPKGGDAAVLFKAPSGAGLSAILSNELEKIVGEADDASAVALRG